MERRVEFRAWDKRGKCLIDWLCMCQTAFNRGEYSLMYEILAGQKLDTVLMQFTGIYDKKGNQIFEGDIVHYLYQPGECFANYNQISTITWDATGFYLKPIKGGLSAWLISVPGASVSKEPNKYFEVLGNIYQNPELLEAQGCNKHPQPAGDNA